jgi:hypothetical protein
MNLDDNSPNPTGSNALVFTGSGQQTIDLPPSALGDGYHGEGVTCVPLDCVNVECPPVTVTPSPPPTPTPAVQNPTISLDMDETGNTYSNPGAGGDNSMSVGTTESCSTTAAPGNNNTHTHSAHFIIRNVEDLIGWQARLNYDGGKMRPNAVNFAPFTDTTNPLQPQGVSFVNLPIDAGTNLHRGIVGGTNIPAPAPGPQTTLVGSVYEGTQNFAISPDTPAKAPPDDTSYSAPTGGVVAALDLQVLAGNAGNASLFMNLDDNSPNPPGSTAVIFTGTGQQTIDLAPSALGDGFHGEGATCVPLDCVNVECPPTTPTPSPPPTPTPSAAGHDANLRPISGVPNEVRLSPGEIISDKTKLTVVNNAAHAETIGVYVDLEAPATGGCTPSGRLLQTTVTLAAGRQTTINVPVNYSCADPGAANGQTYKWTAVADHAANDLAACGPGTLRTATCINALNNDDESGFAGHVKTRDAPQVIAQ